MTRDRTPVFRRKENCCVNCGGSLLLRDIHHLGCDLESIADILRYRGLEQEATELDRLAARIK